MKIEPLSTIGRIRLQRWLALALSGGLGGLLVVVLLAGLSPRPAAAAAPAEPAYACTEGGLDLALAAGGSATFSCGSPTTVTVSARKNVVHDLTLDGGNNLILSGNSMTGVFTVATGIHLSLLNLTLRDAPATIRNNGVLNVTHAHFISDTAGSLYNYSGSTAIISDTTVENGSNMGGALNNGGFAVTQTASLSVINSTFHDNFGFGAAIFNIHGAVTVSGSNFYSNHSFAGGAIFNQSKLSVTGSQFSNNTANAFILDSQDQIPVSQEAPAIPSGLGASGGGAIYITPDADTTIASSSFNGNFAAQGGGAILFGLLPPGGGVTPTTNSLVIANSTFFDNCSGTGGALAANVTTTVSDSSFSQNFADSGSNPCVLWLTSHPSALQQAAAAGQAKILSILNPPPNLNGAGGAIFNSSHLTITHTEFLTNSANLTDTGGGGAIESYFGSGLAIAQSTFADNTAEQDGGAIFNGGVATVIGSDFERNTATNDSGGAVANLGSLTVSYSSFTANSGAPHGGKLAHGGGAIDSEAAALAANGPSQSNSRPNGSRRPAAPNILLVELLTVDHSRFISNSSEYEGGAIDAADANILASTFTSNTAKYGGALDVLNDNFVVSASTFIANAVVTTTQGSPSDGGAIDTNSSNITVVNSTFFGNIASGGAVGGAISVEGGSPAITNSTFLSNTAETPGNGGGFSGNGSVKAHNLLIAYNVGGNCETTMALTSHDLDFPGSTCGGSALNTDPLAQTPANNGGPTLTSALLAGSPAIDAGDDSSCPSTDQRGAHRPVGLHCDIGAFEFGGQVPWLWLPLIRK